MNNDTNTNSVSNSANQTESEEITVKSAFLNTDEIQFRINDSGLSATIWIDNGHGEPKAVAQFASFDKVMGNDFANSPIAVSMLKGLFGIFAGRKALGVGAVINVLAVKGREEGRVINDCGYARGAYAPKFFGELGQLDPGTVYQIAWDGVYSAHEVPPTGTIENTNKFNHYKAMQALRYSLNKGFKVTISWTPVRDTEGKAIMRNGESLSLLGLAKKVEVAFAVRGNQAETMNLYNEMNDTVEAKEKIAKAVLSDARGNDLPSAETVRGYGGTEYDVDSLVGNEFIVYNKDTKVSMIAFTENNVKHVVAAVLACSTMSIEAVS